jgi:glutaredoxin-related protein
VKEVLSQHNVEFTYVDICGSMSNLKAFLKYRDHHPALEEVRQVGRVGIPCIVINQGERVILGQPENLLELL